MRSDKEIQKLAQEFEKNQKVLIALGDENREHIILQMLKEGKDCSGLRVNEITKMTNLSRPAVSHHLKILKEAGIIKVRHEGTKNYYFFDAQESMAQLEVLAKHAQEIMKTLPDRSGEK